MTGQACSMCGHVADPEVDGDPPLGWSSDHADAAGDGPMRWICPQCTRRYVRSIEAKLDHEWF